MLLSLITACVLLQGNGNALTATSSGGVARASGPAFSDAAVAIATEIAENEVCDLQHAIVDMHQCQYSSVSWYVPNSTFQHI